MILRVQLYTQTVHCTERAVTQPSVEWDPVNIHYKLIIMYVMELGHLLTRSGLTYPEVSSEVCHDSFCQLGNSVPLPWAVCRVAFCLHVVSSSSCIPVVCLEPVLCLIPLQCVNLFCNLPQVYPAVLLITLLILRLSEGQAGVDRRLSKQ